MQWSVWSVCYAFVLLCMASPSTTDGRRFDGTKVSTTLCTRVVSDSNMEVKFPAPSGLIGSFSTNMEANPPSSSPSFNSPSRESGSVKDKDNWSSWCWIFLRTLHDAIE